MRKRRHKATAATAGGHLPMRPTAFVVLAAMARGPRAGFEILEYVNEADPHSGLLGPGTLYRVLRELRQEGWVRRTAAPSAAASQDERRTYMELTATGRAMLHAEAERLKRTLATAGLLGRGMP